MRRDVFDTIARQGYDEAPWRVFGRNCRFYPKPGHVTSELAALGITRPMIQLIESNYTESCGSNPSGPWLPNASDSIYQLYA